MKNLHPYIIATMLAITCGLSAQTSMVYNNRVPNGSVAFFLPQTELTISVNYHKTEYYPAPFANYAKRFLAIDNAISKRETEYKIESINIVAKPVADSIKHFAVVINPKSVAYKIECDSEGVIKSINSNVEQPHSADLRSMHSSNSTETAFEGFDYSYLSQEAIQAASEVKMAETVAKQIFDIRENKLDLISGNSDNKMQGEALEFAINELNKQEEALWELFAGKKNRVDYQTNIVYTPNAENEDNEIVARFSKQLGMVDSDDMAGSPITIKVTANFTSEHSYAANSVVFNKKEAEIPYNVCGNGKFSIFYNGKEMDNIELLVPQFGHIELLPAKMFNNKTTSVEFSQFGSIKAIR